MPYGGVRRRPGPLLGGSAILAKRNNQQRQQYLQQLQTLVHQKGNDYGNEQSSNGTSTQLANNIQNPLSGFDNNTHHQTSLGNDQSLMQIKENMISNHYPDLLSHEVPQHNMYSMGNNLPSQLQPMDKDIPFNCEQLHPNSGAIFFIIF